MLASPADSMTLQDLVRNEIKAKKHVAAEGLVWLVRYVDCVPRMPRYPSMSRYPCLPC